MVGTPAPAHAACRRLVAWLQVSTFSRMKRELQPSEPHLLCQGKVLETLQKQTQPSDDPSRAKVRESDVALDRFYRWDRLVYNCLRCLLVMNSKKKNMTVGKGAEKILSDWKRCLFILRSRLAVSCNVFMLECTSEYTVV